MESQYQEAEGIKRKQEKNGELPVQALYKNFKKTTIKLSVNHLSWLKNLLNLLNFFILS